MEALAEGLEGRPYRAEVLAMFARPSRSTPGAASSHRNTSVGLGREPSQRSRTRQACLVLSEIRMRSCFGIHTAMASTSSPAVADLAIREFVGEYVDVFRSVRTSLNDICQIARSKS
jgi:hypothetical protein